MDSNKAAWTAVAILGFVFVVACLVLAIIAVWSKGDTSSHLGGTAAILGIAGGLLLVARFMKWIEE